MLKKNGKIPRIFKLLKTAVQSSIIDNIRVQVGKKNKLIIINITMSCFLLKINTIFAHHFEQGK